MLFIARRSRIWFPWNTQWNNEIQSWINWNIFRRNNVLDGKLVTFLTASSAQRSLKEKLCCSGYCCSCWRGIKFKKIFLRTKFVPQRTKNVPMGTKNVREIRVNECTASRYLETNTCRTCSPPHWFNDTWYKKIPNLWWKILAPKKILLVKAAVFNAKGHSLECYVSWNHFLLFFAVKLGQHSRSRMNSVPQCLLGLMSICSNHCAYNFPLPPLTPPALFSPLNSLSL